jgi:hypothetical protein
VAYADVIPKVFGNVTFTVHALYEDGGVSTEEITASVSASTRPETFFADAHFRVIGMNTEESLNAYELQPIAAYAGSPEWVRLDGRAVQYTVLATDGAAPVVEIRPDIYEQHDGSVAVVDSGPGWQQLRLVSGQRSTRFR